MAFDPKKYLIKVQGNRQYLPVSARLIWFREEHPDWGIETRAVAIDLEKQYAIFEATITNAEGKIMAKGTKMENVKGFGDYLEKAETGSVGRALALCGYGTQFSPEMDESGNGRVVDSPQPMGGYRPSNAGQNSAGYGARPGGYEQRGNGGGSYESRYSGGANGGQSGNGNGGYRPVPPSPEGRGSDDYRAPEPRAEERPPLAEARPTSPEPRAPLQSAIPRDLVDSRPREDRSPELRISEEPRRPTIPAPTPAHADEKDPFDDSLYGSASNGGNSAPAPSGTESCEACGTGLKPSQMTLSMRKFGAALCPECQKKRRSAEMVG